MIEHLEDLLIGFSDAKSLEEGGDVLATLAIDPDTDCVLLVGVELEPGAATGDDLSGVDHFVGGFVWRLGKVDARRTDELGNDDPLGPVDDENALLRHDREVAKEHLLLLDLTGLAVHEPGGDEHGEGVVGVALLGLFDGHLRLTKTVIRQFERKRTGEVLDRAHLVEDLLQALIEEPLEGLVLNS